MIFAFSGMNFLSSLRVASRVFDIVIGRECLVVGRINDVIVFGIGMSFHIEILLSIGAVYDFFRPHSLRVFINRHFPFSLLRTYTNNPVKMLELYFFFML